MPGASERAGRPRGRRLVRRVTLGLDADALQAQLVLIDRPVDGADPVPPMRRACLAGRAYRCQRVADELAVVHGDDIELELALQERGDLLEELRQPRDELMQSAEQAIHVSRIAESWVAVGRQLGVVECANRLARLGG